MTDLLLWLMPVLCQFRYNKWLSSGKILLKELYSLLVDFLQASNTSIKCHGTWDDVPLNATSPQRNCL